MAGDSPTGVAVASRTRAGARPAAVRAEWLYRALDLLLASACLLACAPLVAIAWLAIRLESPGPAVFRQQRLGRDRRPFTVHKLRTMHVGASPDAHRRFVGELINGAERPRSDGRRQLYKLTGDDRVTRVGGLLRRTSVDELPQLFDVLAGHMSIVGPRPVTPYEAELYPPGYEGRFAVRPGVTGLWQVSGRNECTYREMLALDLAWVAQRSPRHYVAIVARTPWVLLRARGAA
jgi:lipopolysaccharide/colanic/teichoic acid biosynthesis glycosyltransferase